jgi:hypothetical protein
LPYCVFAIADRGVVRFPGPWCAAVLTLSEAAAKWAPAIPMPAVEERISASRRVTPARFFESTMKPPSLNR